MSTTVDVRPSVTRLRWREVIRDYLGELTTRGQETPGWTTMATVSRRARLIKIVALRTYRIKRSVTDTSFNVLVLALNGRRADYIVL